MQKVNEYFKINEEDFIKLKVFNPYVNLDSRLFLDPHLLKFTSQPEFANSRNRIEDHFRIVIKLIMASKSKNDVAWNAAWNKLIFRELRGLSIGLSKTSGNGSGIGPGLALKLTERAKELIDLGIDDPELFEVLGLFVEDFGPDRLSDLTAKIIRKDIYSYTENITKKLGIQKTFRFSSDSDSYILPVHPNGKHHLLFLPEDLLRDLPVATDYEDISRIASFNSNLRARFNKLLSEVFSDEKKKNRKENFWKAIKENPSDVSALIKGYQNYPNKSYDFTVDTLGDFISKEDSEKFTQNNPLSLKLNAQPKQEDLDLLVLELIEHFKTNVENKGFFKAFYYPKKGLRKHRNERYSQLLFYFVADTYCKANNIDISVEPNAGNGPVDFKFSKGYQLKHLVEIKHSSNDLVHGYTKQLEKYMKSEGTDRSTFLVINSNRNVNKINSIYALQKKSLEEGNNPPKIVVINTHWRFSASIKR